MELRIIFGKMCLEKIKIYLNTDSNWRSVLRFSIKFYYKEKYFYNLKCKHYFEVKSQAV